MEQKPLTILCIPQSALGHIHAALGFTRILKERGHRVVYAAERSWAGKFEKLGYEEEIYDELDESSRGSGGQFWNDLLRSLSPYFRKSTLGQLEMTEALYRTFLLLAKRTNERLKAIIATTKPDIIIHDHYVSYPCILTAGVPYVHLFSANPVRLFYSRNIPPFSSGYPLNEDKSNWEPFFERQEELIRPVWTEYNEWVMEEGAPPLEDMFWMHFTSNLNLYLFPKELTAIYLNHAPMPPQWQGLDHCVQPSTVNFEIPDKLKNLPGKLIYVSMGSIGSSDVELMKLLVAALSTCPHRFIFSLGPAHKEYSIAENMWGEPLVPQTAILEKVDLAIVHGGNNGFTECLYYGKPMILIPLFMDQNDNGQIAVEAKVGVKFNPFHESADVLHKHIEHLLNDKEILERVKAISQRLRASTSLEENADRLEAVARNPKHAPFTDTEKSTPSQQIGLNNNNE